MLSLGKLVTLIAMKQDVYRTTLKLDDEAQLGAMPQTVPLTVQVNRRAKRIILRVDDMSGEVIATAPSKSTVKDAIKFAGEKAQWISSQRANCRPPHPFRANCIFPFLGSAVRIRLDGGPRRPIKLKDGILFVGGEEQFVNRRVTDWLKREARAYLTDRADTYSAHLGKKRGPIRIKDMKSRWGSCASDGTIAFSWRIIMAPAPIADYVAAHECTHLVHMNHSPAYWRTLQSLGTDANAARDWFKRHGHALFRWGVSTD